MLLWYTNNEAFFTDELWVSTSPSIKTLVTLILLYIYAVYKTPTHSNDYCHKSSNTYFNNYKQA